MIRSKKQEEVSVYLQGKTAGHRSSEHRITWVTMLASLLAIVAQVAGKLFLKVDLGVDIDLALLTGFGSGTAYTAARMVVKTGVAFAEGKVKAAKATRPKEEPTDGTAGTDGPVGQSGVAIPPARSPLAMMNPQEETKIW